MKSIKLYKRTLNIDLPKGQSAFLWGPRKSGKTTYLKLRFPQSIYYDLLKSDLFLKLSKAPHILREEILALPAKKLQYPIIIDEVQKIPHLLDEIHWLIENTTAYFILCGSSAKQLKRSHVNLLGGRAWRYQFFPLTSREIEDINLIHAFNHGLIPSHYLSSFPRKMLDAYVQDYLTEEIRAEGLVRNLPAFAQFLDIVPFSNGQMVNYTNISRECGIDVKTVQSYYQILVDTLLGYFIRPYTKQTKRQIISATPKFYFCDTGIVNHLKKHTINHLKGANAGHSFEHFIFMEIMAYRTIMDQLFDIRYWRTSTRLEVDFILGNADVAIEVKISTNVSSTDIKGLLAFKKDNPKTRAIVVCLADQPRLVTSSKGYDYHILPWRQFLDHLWQGTLI